MECSNCLSKVSPKYRTVCQQCLIDIEDSKDYAEKELEKLKTKFNQRTDELDNIDLEQLSKAIKKGNTSGRLDNEEGKHIYWELKVNVWKG